MSFVAATMLLKLLLHKKLNTIITFKYLSVAIRIVVTTEV